MKKIIRLYENDLHKMVRESVHHLLTENKMEEYQTILQNEFLKAQKDVQDSRATFHEGIRKSLLSKGYTILSFGDNHISFYGQSRLFCFYAHEDYDSTNYRSPWILSSKIRITFSNYTWKERYQYPNYYNDREDKEIRINDFPAFYQKTSEEIGEPLTLKPFKAKHENIDEYHKFKVVNKNGRHDETLGEFDNFQDAKERAYEYAKTECDYGKKTNDITTRYYHHSPIDVTKQFTQYAAAYEYYNCDEHPCYVVVCPA